jgi:hypothetical protein
MNNEHTVDFSGSLAVTGMETMREFLIENKGHMTSTKLAIKDGMGNTCKERD